MVLIAVLTKTTSRGPGLYRSKRVGRDGEEFTLYKFRSMYDGAADERTSLAKHNEQSGPVFKMRDDPRITPLGRLLRKVSADELPQLVNVLSGKMSLVGPRPALPEEVAQYGIRASQRLAVKPGITCIWQVSGRSTIDFDTWIEMDVEYIRSWTLFRDISLLIRTVPAVLSGRGAY
jgi:lipopolysaccharide/colanic/teichoic acid biosynthesis glycosyltransferase